MQRGEDIHRRVGRISAHLNPSTNQVQVYILSFFNYFHFIAKRGISNFNTTIGFCLVTVSCQFSESSLQFGTRILVKKGINAFNNHP